MSNIDQVVKRIAKWGPDGHDFEGRLATSVTIADRDLWINGVRLPWFIRAGEEAPISVEWDDGPGELVAGTVWLPLLMLSDTTIVSDLRSETLEKEFDSGERVQWGNVVVQPEPEEQQTLEEAFAKIAELRDAGWPAATVRHLVNMAYGKGSL